MSLSGWVRHVGGTGHALSGWHRTDNVPDYKDCVASLKERLEESRLEIQRLREENARLLEASTAFGQLAERLNTELQERRLGEADRRRWARIGSPGRRASAPSSHRPEHSDR